MGLCKVINSQWDHRDCRAEHSCLPCPPWLDVRICAVWTLPFPGAPGVHPELPWPSDLLHAGQRSPARNPRPHLPAALQGFASGEQDAEPHSVPTHPPWKDVRHHHPGHSPGLPQVWGHHPGCTSLSSSSPWGVSASDACRTHNCGDHVPFTEALGLHSRPRHPHCCDLSDTSAGREPVLKGELQGRDSTAEVSTTCGTRHSEWKGMQSSPPTHSPAPPRADRLLL
ncbi:uncharacterized protein LOC109489868 isoform X1 [Ailuropoda melanoleuca]|uniref:uncharacterized protein LOC109489868 isoform X1 n=1 Tax=Ailuropoda melanoleuca TaxID=9646 RepID=UPI00149505C4|nr:uncharacterized protein LOC109489868 isoform X1 [Ailuropoda melanoleuca]